MASELAGTVKQDRPAYYSNLPVENLLRRKKIAFETIFLLESEINWEASEKNLGRIGQRIVDEHVDALAREVSAGNPLPRCVANYVAETGKYDIMGGVHTAKSLTKCGYEVIPAYKIEVTNPYLLAALPMILNTMNGLSVPKDARMSMAVSSVINNPEVSISRIAADLGLEVSSINSKLKLREIDQKLLEVRINPNVLSEKVRQGAYKFREHPAVLKKLADVIVASGLEGADVDSVLGMVASKLTECEASALEYLDEKAKYNLKVEGDLHDKRKVYSVFRRHLRAVLNWLKRHPTASSNEMETGQQFEEIQRLLNAITKKTTSILEVYISSPADPRSSE